MATIVITEKFDRHHSIARPQKPPVRRKNIRDISHLSRVIANFDQNFVAMATRVITEKFDWHRSIARPQKPPVRCKNIRDISHISRVIANFDQNFVAMATRVGRGRIWLTSLNRPTLKNPWSMQESWTYLSYKPSYNQFWPKFRCHGNQGRSRKNLTDIAQ